MPCLINVASFAVTKNDNMGIFDSKKEKKLRKELTKKNTAFCRETVKDMEELHDELKSAYEALDTIADEFAAFKDVLMQKLTEEENIRMDYFIKKFRKLDKISRDAVRDVRDQLRLQKKRLREAINEK